MNFAIEACNPVDKTAWSFSFKWGDWILWFKSSALTPFEEITSGIEMWYPGHKYLRTKQNMICSCCRSINASKSRRVASFN